MTKTSERENLSSSFSHKIDEEIELKDTIAAVATPLGMGGVGIVRVSGPLSKDIAYNLLNKLPKPRLAHYGPFYDDAQKVIDKGLALYFKAPHSFTGEDVLELQGHGGPVVLDLVLRQVLNCGARPARPGEFLERAFLNDKIDLTQAEAIADLISASSEKAARSAINSLQGLFSKKIHELLEGIIFIRTFIEASIDFADEEIDPMDKKSLENQLNTVLDKLNEIKESAKQGTLLKEGMNLVIAGKPNVGKSSLLNCLSGRESAIVTDIAGTTRDVLKEYIHIDGMPLHIIDTAGLRDTDDVIEKEGVKRAFKEVEKADEVLLVVDQSKTDENDCDLLLQGIKEKLPIGAAITLIENKIDLTGQTPRIEEKETLTKIYLSVKTGQGIELLKRHLEKRMGFNAKAEGLFIARRRHLEAISKAKEAIEFSLSSLKQNQSEELVAEHLRYAQNALSEITGEFTSDDLLCEIFRTFCLGK